MALDHSTVCGEVAPERDHFTPRGAPSRVLQRVVCNRVRGHDGPHELRDATTFEIRVAWPRK